MAKRAAVATPDEGGEKREEKSPFLIIKPPTIGVVTIKIVGIAALMLHAWSEKARRKMLAGMQKVDSGTAPKKPREKRDPFADYNGARYTYRGADKKNRPLEWDGIPAVAFKASLVGACRQVAGLSMTDARRMIFVRYDELVYYHSPFSTKTEIGLVRIHGVPEMREDAVRINNGKSTDLAYRPQYWPWSAVLAIEFNASILTPNAIANLVATAGYFEGVGEWRPGSKESNSGQLGRWEVQGTQ